MLSWENNNPNNYYDFADQYCTEMFKLFTKFYFMTFIFFILLLKAMIIEDVILGFAFGPVWLT
jgi:hypothetical protein